MGRWEPDARGRLGQAAMELYFERGYEQTTVADIAERAGVTARTFFRHFADKREVVFDGSDRLGAQLTAAVVAAPAADGPLAVVGAALEVVSDIIGGDHDHSVHRQTVINANPELHERERTKMASWSHLLVGALHERGVDEPAASLAAETGVAVFRVAFARWLEGPGDVALSATVRQSFEQLRGVVG